MSKNKVDNCIEQLRELGLLFFSKREQTVYVPNEIVDMLHIIEGKELNDKYLRRILRVLSNAEISNIYKSEGKKARGVPRLEKVKNILKMNLDVSSILTGRIHSEDTALNERKERLKDLIDDLDIPVEKLGSTIEQRTDLIIKTLKDLGVSEFTVLSATGFNDLYKSLKELLPSVEGRLRQEFEIEETEELGPESLRALNITPFDILYLLTNQECKGICESLQISKRGNIRLNIINNFINANDKLIENYELLARRDISALRELGIDTPEAELGIKFEEATRAIFEHLQLNVDEGLRQQGNSAKNKADIIISLNETDIIIVEAKTHKRGCFSTYSTTSRQVKSYVKHYEALGKRVYRVLVLAPCFTDDFIESAERDFDINISLLEAEGLKTILAAYNSKKKPKFSPMLFTKGILLKADFLAKSI